MSLPYRLIVGAIRGVAPLLSVGESKLARGMVGRLGAHQLLEMWGQTLRDPERPVAWFHAPSVGEGLQAAAVIRALVERRPDMQIVFTFFSPSAEALAREVGADVAAYLPWDLRRTVGSVLDSIHADLLVFTKTEVWPTLTEEAVRRGVPVAIVGASVPEGAGRFRAPARWFLRPTWGRLTLACAGAEADAVRLLAMGVPASALHTTGDPSVDAAAERANSVDLRAPWLVPFQDDMRPTVVAGSTWVEDDVRLLPALFSVRTAVPPVRAIIAPHEPGATRVNALVEQLRGKGWSVATLSAVERTSSVAGIDAVVVDRVGVLVDLYTLADIVYVGGGYGGRGLHSVLEPAAAGKPVVFGPKYHRAPAAYGLLELNGAKIAADAGAMAEVLMGWLRDGDGCEQAGRRAFDYIESRRGAAQRTAELLDQLTRSEPA